MIHVSGYAFLTGVLVAVWLLAALFWIIALILLFIVPFLTKK